MDKRASFLIAACALSLWSCDHVFEEKNASEPSDRGMVPTPLSPPISETEPWTDDRPAEHMPSNGSNHGAEIPIENDLDTTHEIALIESRNVRNFAAWIQTPEGFDQISRVGMYKSSENEVDLHHDMLLSFSSFAQEKPLRIRTHGHKLILLGHSMKNLFVETQGEGRASGDVIIFLSGSELPTINSEGKDGHAGIDAQCTDPLGRCVSIADRATRRATVGAAFTWITESREARYDWHSSFVHDQMKEKIRRLAQRRSAEDIARDICDTSQTIQVDLSEPLIAGQIILKQTIKIPISNPPSVDDENPNARLVEGEIGGDGQNAGEVRIFQLADRSQQIELTVKGGKSGKGGRNIKIPAVGKTDEVALASAVISEQISLVGLTVKRNASASCVSEIGQRPHRVFKSYNELFSLSEFDTTTGTILDRQSLTILPRAAGEDLNPLTPEIARSGAEGKIATARLKTVQSWKSWRGLIPEGIELPQEVLYQSPSSISPGRLSGEALGLKTLPL